MTDNFQRYCFVLGLNPLLSVSEIVSLLPRHKVVSYSTEILYVEGQEVNEAIIDQLGGTIKIIRILSDINNENITNEILIQEIFKIIESYPLSNEAKLHFGISVYDNHGDQSIIHHLSQSLQTMYRTLKEKSRNSGINLAFVNSKERYLSSASVQKNRLCQKHGLEISLIANDKKILIGITKAVQDIDKYSHFDIDRPVRDLKSGTTPPKLAKIMINLANQNKDATIIDPFCGSGTFLQEMLLLGYQNIYGSDISPKAINDSRTNINWLIEQIKPDINIDIFQSDVRRLSEIFNAKTIDAVVGEGYLGPALTKMLTDNQFNQLNFELTKFYGQTLAELSKVLYQSGRIVLALPIYKTKKGNRYLSIGNVINELGLKNVIPFNDADDIYKQYISPRKSIVYFRPDQFVLREIMILCKQ